MDDLIRMVKSGCGHDGFLQWLHILVLMDDTVLLATTRYNMLRKISLLQAYCREYGMKINQSKTKFFAIHGKGEDLDPMVIDELVVEPCDMYIYLGSPFTSDGSTSSAVRAHANSKMPHILKFVSFIRKNSDIPFNIKKRVFDAALMSTLLYGCESWVGADLKPMTKLYNWGLKTLLGVRRSTCNDVCYVESGYPPLCDLVKYKQHKFFHTMWRDRAAYDDDPLSFVINMVTGSNTCTARSVREFLDNDIEYISVAMQRVIENIQNSDSSRRITYRDINPDFSIHSVYREKHVINETHRLAFTQFRVSGHSLACETGRWNRRGRGRLPLDQRLCACGQIQTERHVTQVCALSQSIREKYNFVELETLFSNTFTAEITCKIIYEILSIYP